MIKHLHANTIRILQITSRLLDLPCALVPEHPFTITQRKLVARIRITEEALEDISVGPFTQAVKNDAQGLINDIAACTDAFLRADANVQNSLLQLQTPIWTSEPSKA